MKRIGLFCVLFVGLVFSVFGQRTNIDPFNFTLKNNGWVEWQYEVKIYAKSEITDIEWFERMKTRTNRDYTATLEYIDYNINIPGRPTYIMLGTPYYNIEWAGYFERAIPGITNDDYIVCVKMSIWSYGAPGNIKDNIGHRYNAIAASNKKIISRDDKGTFTHYVHNAIGMRLWELFPAIKQNFLAGYILQTKQPETSFQW